MKWTEREHINVTRALQLRKQNLPWRRIGQILAKEMQREVPFWPNSVKRAIQDQRKKERNDYA